MNKRPRDFESFEPEEANLPPFDRTGCPSIQVLRAANLNALPEELQGRVSAHLVQCALCRTLQLDLKTLPPQSDASPQEVDRILGRVRRQQAGSRLRGWMFSWKAAVATAGLLLCSLLIYQQMRNDGLSPDSFQRPAVVQQEKSVPDIPGALQLQKPAVKLTLSVLTWRGQEDGPEQFTKDLAPALELYRSDRFAEAAAQLESLASKYERSVEVFFYLGVSRLMLSQFPAARDALEHAQNLGDDSFSADILWYLAIAYQRSGRLEDSLSLLHQLCSEPNEFRDKACAGLKELGSAAAKPLTSGPHP